MITLYDYELSGNCYKLRLLLHMLDVPYESVPVEFYPGKEHLSDAFLQINPLGQLPVLQDDNLVLRDAQAILVYLASRYDASRQWYPIGNPALLGQLSQWLAFADSLTATASMARLHDAMGYHADITACRAGAHRLFRVLDEHLWFMQHEGRRWLCPGEHPTIADIACFPYVALSGEGGIPHDNYPAVRRWIDDIRQLPRFIVMPGIFP